MTPKNACEEIVFRLSTPQGVVDLGWKLEGEHESNILCLPCMAKKKVHASETMEAFVDHIIKKHPETAHFLQLRNYRKMIV